MIKLSDHGVKIAGLAIEQIEAHPDEYDQGTYHCGTRACLAGWIAMVHTGNRINEWGDDDDYSSDEYIQVDKDGEERHVSDVAADALGILHPAAHYLLFNSDLTLEEIKANLQRLTVGIEDQEWNW